MSELTKNQAQWKVHIDAASAANQTLAEYARHNKIELKKLYSYNSAIQRRLTSAAKPTFVRVQRPSTPPVEVHIELNNGIRVNVATPTDLVSLLAQLAQLP